MARPSPFTRFWREEDGSTFLFGFMLVLAFFMIGGLAVDVASAYMNRTQLQVAADSAAHAALYMRNTKHTADQSKAEALAVADIAMPSSRFGDILRAEDVQFGRWDAATQTFSPDPASKDAVQVDTARLAERSNPVSTYFLRIFNVSFWNVRTRSVFETYIPTCMREGFVGEDIVDVQSGNTYKSGFCIHSQTHVEVNSNNLFEDGVIVSMPNEDDIVLPSSGFESNPGLEPALRDGSYQIGINSRVDEIIAGVQDPTSSFYPSYLTSPTKVNVSRHGDGILNQSVFLPGSIYNIGCATEGQSVQIHTDTVLKEVVLITNCELMFGEGVAMEDAILLSTNTHSDAINAASGVRLGMDDHCANGGGAQIVTKGGVRIPAQLEMYGGQIIAADDVSFTSLADGMEGASIISGGRIDGTTGSTMAFCGGAGMDNNFEREYFRLAL